MQVSLPPDIHNAAFLGGRPLWVWLQDNGQRVTPQTMRDIVEGQHLILSRLGRVPLLVTAQHDAGGHVEIMGLHLMGNGYNNVVAPGNISEGAWNLYILPNQIADLIVQAPAAEDPPVVFNDPEEAAFEASLQAAAPAAVAALINDPVNNMNNDPINPPPKGGRRKTKRKSRKSSRRRRHRKSRKN